MASPGDRFTWHDTVHIEVIRVSRDQKWADIECWTETGTSPNIVGPKWEKRQALPFPEDFILIATGMSWSDQPLR